MVLCISIRIPCSFKKEEKIPKDQEEQTHLAIDETAKDKLHLAKEEQNSSYPRSGSPGHAWSSAAPAAEAGGPGAALSTALVQPYSVTHSFTSL